MLARPCRAGFDRFAVYPSHLTRVWWAFFEKVSACSAGPAPTSWSASSSSIALITYSASALINSLRLIEPSSNLGIVACSGMLSARLSIAAPNLSLESVMPAVPDSKARDAPPFFQSRLNLPRLRQLFRRYLISRSAPTHDSIFELLYNSCLTCRNALRGTPQKRGSHD